MKFYEQSGHGLRVLLCVFCAVSLTYFGFSVAFSRTVDTVIAAVVSAFLLLLVLQSFAAIYIEENGIGYRQFLCRRFIAYENIAYWGTRTVRAGGGHQDMVVLSAYPKAGKAKGCTFTLIHRKELERALTRHAPDARRVLPDTGRA